MKDRKNVFQKKGFRMTISMLLVLTTVFSLIPSIPVYAEPVGFSGTENIEVTENTEFDLLNGVSATGQNGEKLQVQIAGVTCDNDPAYQYDGSTVLKVGQAGNVYTVNYTAKAAAPTPPPTEQPSEPQPLTPLAPPQNDAGNLVPITPPQNDGENLAPITPLQNDGGNLLPITPPQNDAGNPASAAPTSPEMGQRDGGLQTQMMSMNVAGGLTVEPYEEANPLLPQFPPIESQTNGQENNADTTDLTQPQQREILPSLTQPTPPTQSTEEYTAQRKITSVSDIDHLKDKGYEIIFKDGLHSVRDPEYRKTIILYCMNNLRNWPHTTDKVPQVPNYDDGYLTEQNFASPEQYHEFMRKLEKLLFAGYPFNGERLYKIVQDGELHVPTREEFNAMLIVPPQLQPDFPRLMHHQFSLEDLETYYQTNGRKREHLEILHEFFGQVAALYPDKHTPSGLSYSDIISMPFYKAAFCLTCEYQEGPQAAFTHFYSGQYFVTEKQAYDNTQAAVWNLLYQYKIEDNNLASIETYPLGKILLQYMEHGDLLKTRPKAEDLRIEGDLSFRYNPADGLWHSGKVKIVEPSNYNGLYELKMPPDVHALCDNLTYVYGNEEYELISDHNPVYGTSFQIIAHIDWLQTLKQYHPMKDLIYDGKRFQNMVGAIVAEEKIVLNPYVAPAEEGGLDIVKTVVGDETDKQKEFHFTLTLSEKINGKHGDLTFTDGVAHFTLKDGESKKAESLPVGATYEVVEDPSAQQDFAIYPFRDKGTIRHNKIIYASFMNVRKTERTVTKIWDDNNNNDNKRPDSIQVQLYADGWKVDEAVTLNEANHWTYTWKNLNKYEDGKEIQYTVEEVKVPEGYQEMIQPDKNGNFYITNIHSTDLVNKSVRKIWIDENDKDGLRPRWLKVQLYANETVKVGPPIKLSAFSKWEYTWQNLPKYYNGKEIEYTVKEVVPPEGYTLEVTKDKDGNIILTNTHKVEVLQKSVTKVWDDENNKDGLRPQSVKVQLYANNQKAGDEVVLSAANNWSYQWNNLPKYFEGKEVYYSVHEPEPPKGYTPMVEEKDGKFTVTNVHTHETVKKNVTKVWDDNNDADRIRPASVEVQLIADGQAVGDVITLNEANHWEYEWKDLPKYQDGKELDYTVQEINVPQGYVPSVSVSPDGIVLTNTRQEEGGGERPDPDPNPNPRPDPDPDPNPRPDPDPDTPDGGEGGSNDASLIVSKVVKGENGDKEKQFSFEVKITSKTGRQVDGVYRATLRQDDEVLNHKKVRFTDNKTEFKLSHGQSITIEDLPKGCSYTVTEREANHDGYHTTYNGKKKAATGRLKTETEVEIVNLKNKRKLFPTLPSEITPTKPTAPTETTDSTDTPVSNNVPNTGVAENTQGTGALIAVGAAGLLLLGYSIFRQKRRGH